MFAALALVLVVVGVYGVMSHDVRQRARDRHPARPRRGQVVRDADGVGGRMRIASTGIAAGAVLALAAARLIAGLLFGVSAADPWTYGVLTALLLAIAVAAAYLPARRAARISPRALMDPEARAQREARGS
jgi:putative ABC transport system permease protein